MIGQTSSRVAASEGSDPLVPQPLRGWKHDCFPIGTACVEIRQFSEERDMKSIVFLILFASLAVISPSAVPIPQQGTLRENVNLVSIYFTVRDKRERPVTDLTKEAFKVFEDGQPQQISFFALHSDVPMNVGVLLDTSTAMARTLGLEADAASRFFRTVMRPNDQGFLVSYASHIDVLQVPIEDAERLADRAQEVRKNARIFDDGPLKPPQSTSPFPGGGRLPLPIPTTPPNMPDAASLRVAKLYDAVNQSVERFLSREFGRKAIVIAALADDARSESSIHDALKTLKENDVIAYVLEVQHAPKTRDDCDIRHIFRNEDEYRIGRLAIETGGRVIRVEGFEKMQAAFEQIADELHRQYSLGYRPTNQNWDGAFRKVKIEAAKGFKISARDGYYARPRQ
jgi:VWFA-related protein